MEYLKIAQDLEMYGVNYFQIKVSNLVLLLWFGKSACALEMYRLTCIVIGHLVMYLQNVISQCYADLVMYLQNVIGYGDLVMYIQNVICYGDLVMYIQNAI